MCAVALAPKDTPPRSTPRKLAAGYLHGGAQPIAACMHCRRMQPSSQPCDTQALHGHFRCMILCALSGGLEVGGQGVTEGRTSAVTWVNLRSGPVRCMSLDMEEDRESLLPPPRWATWWWWTAAW